LSLFFNIDEPGREPSGILRDLQVSCNTVHLGRDTTSAFEQIPPSPPFAKGGRRGDFQRGRGEDFAWVTAKLKTIEVS
jgi:hypothetical protein